MLQDGEDGVLPFANGVITQTAVTRMAGGCFLSTLC